jgi:hypothetical protein
MFYNPITKTYVTTVAIPTNATDSVLRSAVTAFYNSFGSISVTRNMYDVDGAEVASLSLAAKLTYTIQLNKAINGFTTSSIKVTTSGTTTATVQIAYPQSVQLSSIPLSGSFVINCFHSDGTGNTTRELPYNTGHSVWANNLPYSISSAIVEACPEYRDKLETSEASTYGYMVDGRDILIKFTGIAGDIQQFTIATALNNPL